MLLNNKTTKIYIILTALVITGLLTSVVTANKIVHCYINFPFSNIVFSIFTFPIVDCICELWGKQMARQTIIIALACQILMVVILQLSIITPHASFWFNQNAYQTILSTGSRVVIASILAFLASQLLDIIIYQKIKNITQGKLLWLRSNISTWIGQFVDSSIFITIVFHASNNKLNIFEGSIIFKITVSLLMTPIVYGIVLSVNKYLRYDTLAFKNNG